MNIFLSKKERIAGFFMLLTGFFIVAFFIGTAMQNRWFEPRVIFFTTVVHGEGLRTGSPVLISGIEVGSIGDLTILDDNRIKVELVILQKHAHRIQRGTRAVIRRLVGIGEKRVYLTFPEGVTPPLAKGSVLPSDEPVDFLEAVSSVDLTSYFKTMDRALAAMETLLAKMEENNRLERMVEAFDEMGPTMFQVRTLLEGINDPLITLLQDPSFKRTFDGADKLFNAPSTHKALQHVAVTFEPERMDKLLHDMDNAIVHFDTLIAKDSHLHGAFKGADKLFNDQRVDRILTSVDNLTDEEKLEKLVDNLGIIAEQMAVIGPEVPQITQDLLGTLHEAVIVLKALQKTWLLDDESDKVRKELKK